MLYRDLRQTADHMNRVHTPLHQAILAGSRQEMADRAEQAEGAAHQLLLRLQEALRESAGTVESDFAGGRPERFFAQAAVKALQDTVAQAQRVLPGSDVPSLRAGLLDVMTQADFADAYLRAALGSEEM